MRTMVTMSALGNLKKKIILLEKHGLGFGSHLTKCPVNTKENLFGQAQQIFVNEEVEINDSCRVLCGLIGSDNAKKKFLGKSVRQQKSLIRSWTFTPMFHSMIV